MTDFLITSAISMGVLLAAYHLLLEREKMHRFNRFYLLAAVVLSLGIPFVSLPAVLDVRPELPAILPVSAKVFAAPVIATVQTVNYWPYIGWGMYGLVALGLAIRFAVNIRHFYKVKKQGTTIPYEGAAVVVLDGDILPHTFLNTVFMAGKDYRDEQSAADLLTHELTHLRQRHTLDILFIETVKIVLWFNPLVYLYKRAMQMNHEFLADENVVSRHPDVPAYQQLLLEKAIPAPVYTLASSINFNITKKRFIMMTKTTTKTRAAILQLAVLPIVAVLTLLSCSTSEISESKTEGLSAFDGIDATNSKIEVSAVTEEEKRVLLVTDSKTFDDPSADYSRITLIHQGKDGKVTEKIHSYVKSEPLVKHDEDGFSAFAKINPDDIMSIDVTSVTQTQMDSLKILNPEKYGSHEAKNYKIIACKLRDGKTISEVKYSNR